MESVMVNRENNAGFLHCQLLRVGGGDFTRTIRIDTQNQRHSVLSTQ